MPAVTSSHIQLTLSCEECGHEWDIEDYDSQSLLDAHMKAEDEPCPECEEEDSE